MFLHVTSAGPLYGFRVEVCFDDGREGIADLTEAIDGPMFEPLKAPNVFGALRVDAELRTILGQLLDLRDLAHRGRPRRGRRRGLGKVVKFQMRPDPLAR